MNSAILDYWALRLFTRSPLVQEYQSMYWSAGMDIHVIHYTVHQEQGWIYLSWSNDSWSKLHNSSTWIPWTPVHIWNAMREFWAEWNEVGNYQILWWVQWRLQDHSLSNTSLLQTSSNSWSYGALQLGVIIRLRKFYGDESTCSIFSFYMVAGKKSAWWVNPRQSSLCDNQLTFPMDKWNRSYLIIGLHRLRCYEFVFVRVKLM